MNKFKLFLIFFLGASAFLAGYVFIEEGSRSSTGSILDKFQDQEKSTEKSTNKVFLASDRRVVSIYNSSTRGSVIYYEKDSGKLFEFNTLEREEVSVSDVSLPNFISATWSPSKEEVIHSFYSASKNIFKHYNLDTLKTTALNPDIKSFAFSPNGNLFVSYVKKESEPGKIFISQPDGQYQKKIFETRIENITVSWPAKDQIVLKTGSAEIFILSETGQLEKFLDSSPLFEEKWSPTGNKILFSTLTEGEEGPTLWTKDRQTLQETPLNIVGLANKCVWSINNVTIICALAKSPSSDEIYAINTLDGSYALLEDINMPVKELLLSPTEDYLFFTSASDDKLYGLEISK